MHLKPFSKKKLPKLIAKHGGGRMMIWRNLVTLTLEYFHY